MRGHPYLIAKPYRTGRYLLIGPGLLPQYREALKTCLTVAFVLVVIVTGVFAAAGTAPATLLRYLSVFWKIALNIVIVVTLVFAVLDIVRGRLLLKQPWDPRQLQPATRERVVVSDGNVGDVATAGVFLVWWLAVPHYHWLLLGPGAPYFAFTPAWDTVHAPVTVCFAIALLVHVVAVVRPRWTRITRWRNVAAHAASVAGAGLLLGAGDLLVAIDPHVDPKTTTIVRAAIRWSLIWTVFIGAVQMLRAFVRTVRSWYG